MKSTTRAILLPLLRSDDTITSAIIDAAISVLESKNSVPSYEDNKELVSKSKAARLLGCSRTTLYKLLAQDRASGVQPPRFLEIETTVGNYQLRMCDVVAVHKQIKGRKRCGP